MRDKIVFNLFPGAGLPTVTIGGGLLEKRFLEGAKDQAYCLHSKEWIMYY
jgi:hypothetical protein